MRGYLLFRTSRTNPHRFVGYWLALILVAGLALAVAACRPASPREILIGIETASISSLLPPEELAPQRTGITSLDELNKKWRVSAITPVFPDLAPGDEVAARQGLQGVLKLVAPPGTDVKAMIADYRADPHVAYAEENKPADIKQ